MAIIYSYPFKHTKRDDLLIGTITYDEDAGKSSSWQPNG